jgi:hypothetical protein
MKTAADIALIVIVVIYGVALLGVLMALTTWVHSKTELNKANALCTFAEAHKLELETELGAEQLKQAAAQTSLLVHNVQQQIAWAEK